MSLLRQLCLGSDTNVIKNRGGSMEQRINVLEEELKVLKSQIKAVLLDIKEFLATGNGNSYTPHGESGGQVGQGPVDSSAGVGPITIGSYGMPGPGPMIGYGAAAAPGPAGGYVDPVHAAGHKPEAELPAADLRDEASERVDHAPHQDQKQQPEDVSMETVGKCVDNQVVDLLTVSVLAQWLSRAIPAVGKGQIGKLVEIYDITGNLPPRLKETMLLLADLYGGSKTEEVEAAEAADDIPASVSIQLLIELDSLLRYRNGALESVVFSMLLDKGSVSGKDSHG